MAKNELLIAITVDADPDYFDASFRGKADGVTWTGVEKGVPLVLAALDSLREKLGVRPPATWFVRADLQVKSLFGRTDHLLQKFASLWEKAKNQGDEIGWHPHLYSLANGKWQQEKTEDQLEKILRETYGDLQQAGYRFQSSRVGDAFASDRVFSILAKLGISADSTAMPGRKRQDEERWFDWTPTPKLPYFPSTEDYRREGSPALPLLELPMSMVPTRCAYDKETFPRYVDLSFHHSVLQAGLREAIQRLPLLITVLHPSSILPELAPKPHDLLSFSSEEFRKNLHFLADECLASGRPFRFVTIRDAAQAWRANA